jgi:hypothetical protein
MNQTTERGIEHEFPLKIEEAGSRTCDLPEFYQL